MKIIFNISRIVLGIIFIFSGFTKVIDPLGSTYKFIDYFNDAFNLTALVPTAFPLALVMSAVEFVVGITLLLGVNMVISAWLALLFILFFTPITLYIAITDSVHDCGCFGDAWVLSNWETFWKNIIFLVPSVIIFYYKDKFKPYLKTKTQWIITISLFVISFAISGYCLKNLPIIDFRPYHIGADIKEYMKIPEDAPRAVYETTLVYKNKETGEKQSFSMENIPTEPIWEWDTTISTLIQPGFVPRIKDLTIEDAEHGDILEEVLADENYNFWLVAYDLSTTNIKGFEKAYEIAKQAKSKNLNFYCLTASLPNEIDALKNTLTERLNLNQEIENNEPTYETIYYGERDGVIEEFHANNLPDDSEGWFLFDTEERLAESGGASNAFPISFYSCDPITLKTIVRSNPGLVLVKSGKVINKWAHANIPSFEETVGSRQ